MLWQSIFQRRDKRLRGRGLDGVKLEVGGECFGMLEAVREVFPDAKYQRCTGRQLCFDAGLCPVATCDWHSVGQQEVHEHEALEDCC